MLHSSWVNIGLSLAFLFVVACSGNSDASQNATGGGGSGGGGHGGSGGSGGHDMTGGGPAAPPALEDQMKGGTRLKGKWLETTDGLSVLVGLHDTLLDIDCSWKPAEDGV